jgi:uncharacterized protein (TIGR00369 family)
MQYKVTGKQPSSKMCVVCGTKNELGLHAHFYELENKEMLAVFTPKAEHQSYPGRMHGGMLTAILDEAIGRAISMYYESMVWGVTLEFNIKFKKPVPLDSEIRVRCRITENEGRIFKGSGEVLLADGRVAVEGAGVYMKLPIEQIADFDHDEQEWRVIPTECDPEVVEF